MLKRFAQQLDKYKPAVDINSGTDLTESACSTSMVVVTKGGGVPWHHKNPPPDPPLRLLRSS